MSFSTAKITRLALTIILISLLLGISACSTMKDVGSSMVSWIPFIGKEEEIEEPEDAVFEQAEIEQGVRPPKEDTAEGEAEPDQSQDAESVVEPLFGDEEETKEVVDLASPIPSSDEVLAYSQEIKRGMIHHGGRLGSVAKVIYGTDGIRLVRPVAVAVKNETVFIADSGLELLLKFDPVSGRMTPIMDLRGVTKGEVSDIYINDDMSFYLADEVGRRVFLFSPSGKKLVTYQNALNLSRPVGVIEDAETGKVLIADAHFDHIVVFSKEGGLLSALGGRGKEPGQFLNITAMARGPDGFYVGARVGQRVQILSNDGLYLYSLPQDTVTFPMAIAADPGYRTFISDYMDNTIKVYERGRLIKSFGGTGVAPGKFKRISDLWLDGEFLYAADTLNGRVQVLRIAPTTASIVSPLDDNLLDDDEFFESDEDLELFFIEE